MHLSQVSGVAMRVEQREPRKSVLPERGNDPVPALRLQNVSHQVPVLAQTRTRHHHPPVLLPGNPVRRRLRREKRQSRRHAPRNIAHSTTTCQLRNGC